MSKTPVDKQVEYLAFLKRSRRIAVISMFGCLLTAVCLILLVYLSKRTYGKEQFENNTRINVVGVLLSASAFVTLIGDRRRFVNVACHDTAVEHKRLIADDERDAKH